MAELVAAILLVAIVAAMVTQRDLFSPAKMFLVSFTLFYLGAWTRSRPPELWLLILVVLLVGAVVVVAETLTGAAARDLPRPGPPVPARADSFTLVIWLLSMPALAAQVAIIEMFGGPIGYINALGNRVLEFRGLGWVRTLTAMLLVINLVYLAIGLVERRRFLWWLGYFLHLVLLVVVGLLSGSRSGVLTVFAMQLMLVHYLRRPVSIARGLMVAVSLVLAAGVLGVVREGVKVEEGRLVTGLADAERLFQSSVFVYGVEPLEILERSDTKELSLGGTFVTLLTNAVPRNLWPGKPDTGGVVFTKQYTGDAWGGASNLTPTFIGEWIINFGWVAGVALFALSYGAVLLATVAAYWRMRRRLAWRTDRHAAIALVSYVCLLWTVIGLMVGEVTNVVLTFALTQLLPLWLLRRLLAGRDEAASPGTTMPPRTRATAVAGGAVLP
jgi:hypothetical protein